MPQPTIRPARTDEYDEIARVWMDSWASTGLEAASNFLLAKLRARIPLEVDRGWSLFVADDGKALAAMLALHLPNLYLDQLFVAPEYRLSELFRGGGDSTVIVERFDRRTMAAKEVARAGQTADNTTFASGSPKASFNVQRPAALVCTR